MNVTRRIARNTAILATAELITAALNLFFTMFVARYLGAEGFGILSFSLAFMSIFTVFTDIGINPFITREIARDKALAQKYLGNVTALKAILAGITFGLIVLTINLLEYPAQTKTVVYISALFLAVNTFCVLYYSIFQAWEKMELITLSRIFNAVLLVAGAITAINLNLNVSAFAWVYALSSSATLLFNIAVSVHRFAKPKIEIDLRFWKGIIVQAWPFGLSLAFTSIYFWIGSVMLSFFKDNEVVGWYNAAFKLVFVLSIIPGVYFTAAFPVMSKFYVSSTDSLQLIYEKSIKYMLLLAVPLATGFTLLADEAITLVYGNNFTNSILILQILVWAVALVFVSSGFARLFESSNKQVIVTIVAGSCALLNVILNAILIPRYSSTGASFATVITEFTALIVFFVWGSKIGFGIPAKKLGKTIIKGVLASFGMGVFVYYFHDLNLFVLLPASTLLYFGVLFIIKGIDEQDIQLLKQVIVKNKIEGQVIPKL